MSAYVLYYVDIMDKNDVEWYLLVPWIKFHLFELISKFKMAAITAISSLQMEKPIPHVHGRLKIRLFFWNDNLPWKKNVPL